MSMTGHARADDGVAADFCTWYCDLFQTRRYRMRTTRWDDTPHFFSQNSEARSAGQVVLIVLC